MNEKTSLLNTYLETCNLQLIILTPPHTPPNAHAPTHRHTQQNTTKTAPHLSRPKSYRTDPHL